jgi:STE24 endopeptidase
VFLVRRGIVRGRQVNRRSNQAARFFSALFIFLAAGLLSARPSRAQQPQAPATTPSPAAAPSSSAQVQGYTLTPGQEAQAIAYAHARHELYFLDVAYGLLLLVLVLQLRVAPAYRDWSAKWTDSGFGQIVVFAPLLLLTLDILSLPTAIWEHHLAVQYQQSIQGWASWLTDWAKGEGVEIAIGILMVWILFAVIRKSPQKWWFWFWLAAVPLIILGAVIEPLIVEPLFYKFTPLANSQPHLAERIEEVVARAGLQIPQSRMFEMNASSKRKDVNAYASGLGATKRVVVWDTSIQRLSEERHQARRRVGHFHPALKRG